MEGDDKNKDEEAPLMENKDPEKNDELAKRLQNPNLKDVKREEIEKDG